MKITVIGTGNGGQAIAGYMAKEGHKITLYGRDREKVAELKELGGITLKGRLKGFGALDCITSNLCEAVEGAEIIMIATTANAHKEIATKLAPYIEDGQIIILNPGRTCGAPAGAKSDGEYPAPSRWSNDCYGCGTLRTVAVFVRLCASGDGD